MTQPPDPIEQLAAELSWTNFEIAELTDLIAGLTKKLEEIAQLVNL